MDYSLSTKALVLQLNITFQIRAQPITFTLTFNERDLGNFIIAMTHKPYYHYQTELFVKIINASDS